MRHRRNGHPSLRRHILDRHLALRHLYAQSFFHLVGTTVTPLSPGCQDSMPNRFSNPVTRTTWPPPRLGEHQGPRPAQHVDTCQALGGPRLPLPQDLHVALAAASNAAHPPAAPSPHERQRRTPQSRTIAAPHPPESASRTSAQPGGTDRQPRAQPPPTPAHPVLRSPRPATPAKAPTDAAYPTPSPQCTCPHQQPQARSASASGSAHTTPTPLPAPSPGNATTPPPQTAAQTPPHPPQATPAAKTEPH